MPKFSSLFILNLSAFLLMVGVGMIVALLPQIVFVETGSLERVGLIASVFALAYLLAQLPVGVLADRFGAKRFLVAGNGLCGLAGLVFFLAPGAGAIYLGRLLQGVGEAPIWALGPALLAIAYPAGRGRAIGAYNAAIHAGLAIGPLVGLAVALTGQGALSFLIFSGLCFVGGGVLFAFLDEPRQGATLAGKAIVPQGLAGLLGARRTMIILVGIFIYGGGYGTFLTVLPVSLGLTNGLPPAAVGLLFAGFYAAIGGAQMVAGPLSDRFGRGAFLVAGMVAAAIGVAALSSAPGLWVFLPFVLASLGLGVFGVASVAALTEAVPDEAKATVAAAYYLFWGAGYFLAPLVIGSAGAEAPLAGFPLLSAAMALQALVAWWHGR